MTEGEHALSIAASRKDGPMEPSAILLPFEMPPNLEPALARAHEYWLGLRRGQADIPFGDDIKLSMLNDATVDLLLVDVFERPLRFRIAIAGIGIERRYGRPIEDAFADEIAPEPPLNYFLSQCSACVESRAPTYYRSANQPFYERLLLPLWGDGHINGLLGAVAPGIR
jgi:hypothetical protein